MDPDVAVAAQLRAPDAIARASVSGPRPPPLSPVRSGAATASPVPPPPPQRREAAHDAVSNAESAAFVEAVPLRPASRPVAWCALSEPRLPAVAAAPVRADEALEADAARALGDDEAARLLALLDDWRRPEEAGYGCSFQRGVPVPRADYAVEEAFPPHAAAAPSPFRVRAPAAAWCDGCAAWVCRSGPR